MTYKSLPLLLLGIFCSVSSAEPVLYSIVDIGPVYSSGYEYQDLKLRINDNNEVVGWSRRSNTSGAPMKAFIWTQSSGMQWIDNSNNVENAALDINNHGQVVGWKRDASGNRQATLWQRDANQTWQSQTPLTVTSEDSYFSAINDNGTLAGNYLSAESVTQAFTWSEGGSTQLLANAGRYIDVSALSDAYVAGSLVNELKQQVAYRSVPGSVPVELPLLAGGEFSVASGVNGAGMIVGGGSTAADVCSRACFSVMHGLHWSDTNIVSDSFAGDAQNSWLESVNNAGLATGWRMAIPSTVAVLVEQGNAYDLNKLAVDASGWKLQRAHDVNEAGYIVGYGTFNQLPHAFVLLPGTVPANAVDLAIAQVFPLQSQKLQGRAITASQEFTFEIKNLGSVTASHVVVNSDFPGGLNLDFLSTSKGQCSVDSVNEKLVCEIDTLQPEEIVTLDMRIIPQPGDYHLTVSVASEERDAGLLDNNVTQVSFKVLAPVDGNSGGVVVQEPVAETGSGSPAPDAGSQGNVSQNGTASNSRSGFGCSLRSSNGFDISLLLGLAVLVFARRWLNA